MGGLNNIAMNKKHNKNQKHMHVSFHFSCFNQLYAFSKDFEIFDPLKFFPLLCFSLVR